VRLIDQGEARMLIFGKARTIRVRAASMHAGAVKRRARAATTRDRVTIMRANMSLVVVAMVLLWIASPVRADDADPIDTALEACLGSDIGQTTAGMIGCTGTAIDAWDARLNETYQKALRAIDPKSRDLLRTAQRQWLAFRTAERAAQGGPWQIGRGTMVRPEIMAATLSAIKERVSELRLYAPDN
jgi:uncharacterized protein YecT (DUF1311 family)